jgi:hypothetical protein
MTRSQSCTVCLIALTNPAIYEEIVNTRNDKKKGVTGAHAVARTVDPSITRWRVEAHFGARAEQDACGDPYIGQSAAGVASARLELSADGRGRIETGEIEGDQPPAWDELIRRLGGDPKTTRVKGDTIRVSAREVTKKTEDGVPYNTIVRAYGASLVPRDSEMDNLAERVNTSVEAIKSGLRGGIKPVPAKKGACRNKNASFFIAWGDTQLGKSAGGGHETTVDRFVDCIARAVDAYEDRVTLGYRYNEVFMSIMGDINEGVAGSYDSQLFTVTLNQCDQVLLSIEVIAWAIEYVRVRTNLPMRVLFVNSNHGDMSRLSMTGGAKNKTTASDTTDRLIASTLQMQYRNEKDIEFLIPGGNLVMTAMLNGVPCAFAHGHGIGARAKALTIQQELVIYDKEITENNGGAPFLPRLWATAHYHSAQFSDVGPYLHVQTPALDGGSEWFTNISGKYSRPGLFVASISAEFEEDGGVSRPEFIFVAKAPKSKRTNWHQKLVDTFNSHHANYGE